jgi:hypothetical protein
MTSPPEVTPPEIMSRPFQTIRYRTPVAGLRLQQWRPPSWEGHWRHGGIHVLVSFNAAQGPRQHRLIRSAEPGIRHFLAELNGPPRLGPTDARWPANLYTSPVARRRESDLDRDAIPLPAPARERWHDHHAMIRSQERQQILGQVADDAPAAAHRQVISWPSLAAVASQYSDLLG